MRRRKAASVVVERRQVLLEVNLHPLAPRLFRVLGCHTDEVGADARSLLIRPDLRVDQEGVIATVPRHVDEPDKRAIFEPRRHLAKAIPADAIPPPRRSVTAVGPRERDKFVIR